MYYNKLVRGEEMSKLKFSPKGFLDFFGKKIFDLANEQNHKLELTGYKYKSKKIPEVFEGFRIIHLSDMHNCVYGKEADELIGIVKRNRPDIVVITGDAFDSRRRQYFDSLDIIEKLSSFVDIYFVCGNHEELSPDLKETFLKKISSFGVKILDGETEEIKRNNSTIYLSGVADFAKYANEMNLFEKAYQKDLSCDEIDEMKARFKEAVNSVGEGKPKGFNILLSHRPEMYETYSENGFDLVFCGHAHGGQFIIPPIGAIYSPGQGFLPKYSEGAHSFGDTTVIVSRGLGNSSFPLRLNNRPQIIVTELHR